MTGVFKNFQPRLGNVIDHFLCHGNVGDEIMPANDDTVTVAYIAIPPVLHGDLYEGDDTCAQAHTLARDEPDDRHHRLLRSGSGRARRVGPADVGAVPGVGAGGRGGPVGGNRFDPGGAAGLISVDGGGWAAANSSPPAAAQISHISS